MFLIDALRTGLPFRHFGDDEWCVISPDGLIVPESHVDAQLQFRADEIISSDWLVRLPDGSETSDARALMKGSHDHASGAQPQQRSA